MVVGASGPPHDPGFVDGVAECDLAAGGQRMAFGHDEVERVFHQGALVEPWVRRRRGGGGGDHERQVGVTGQQQVETTGGFGFDDPHGQVRVVVPQGRRGRGQQMGGGRGETAQGEGPAGPVAGGGQLGARPFGLGLQYLRVAEQGLRRGGQPDAPAGLGDQLDSEIGGQLPQLVRDRGRGVVQRLRGSGHRAVVGHHLQHPQPRVDHVMILHGFVYQRLLIFSSPGRTLRM